jgi:Mg2+ and Co2+ transporter CorA
MNSTISILRPGVFRNRQSSPGQSRLAPARANQHSEDRFNKVVPAPITFRGNEATHITQPLAPLIEAFINEPDPKKLLTTGKIVFPEGGNIVEIRDTHSNTSLMVLKTDDKDPVFWIDFRDNDSPMLARLAKKFSLAQFQQENGYNDDISYERPTIDHDSIQLTGYALGNTDDKKEIEEQTIRIYAGKQFFITTHAQPNRSIDELKALLKETDTYQSPAVLVSSLMDEIIHRNGNTIDSLYRDLKSLTGRISAEDLLVSSKKSSRKDRGIVTDFLATTSKISDMNRILIQQKRVLQDFLNKNKFHKSPLIQAESVKADLEEISKLLDNLNEHRIDNKGLIELYQTTTSNQLNHSMRRLTILSALVGPPTMIAGFIGMNVAIPGSGIPYIFWMLTGGSLVTTAALIGYLKKRNWF